MKSEQADRILLESLVPDLFIRLRRGYSHNNARTARAKLNEHADSISAMLIKPLLDSSGKPVTLDSQCETIDFSIFPKEICPSERAISRLNNKLDSLNIFNVRSLLSYPPNNPTPISAANHFGVDSVFLVSIVLLHVMVHIDGRKAADIPILNGTPLVETYEPAGFVSPEAGILRAQDVFRL